MLKQFKHADDLLRLGHFDGNNPSVNDPNQLDIFLQKPFWIWDQEEHNKVFGKTIGRCCFNHIIGKPQKNNKEFDIFPFQKIIFDAVENYQNIWVLKSRGIGITTFLIRYLAWKILSSTELDNKSIFIISGTREEHANFIKEKLQQLFEKNFPLLRLESKYTELWLKKTWIKVFPTKNVRDIRGYFEASYIWIDESDYMDKSIQDELFYSIGPYQEKSNCKIILSSTPNRPDGLMQRIEKDSSPKWKKLKLHYTYGLGTIYDKKEIEKMKLDIEFKREYECLYLGKVGNLLTPQQIDLSIQLGSKYSVEEIPVSLYTPKSVGVDWGFSSSGTGIVVLEHMKNQFREGIIKEDIIRVIDCHLIEKGNPNSLVELCWDIWKRFNYMNVWFFCDAANAGMTNLMKVRWNENTNWTKAEDVSPSNNKIIPVSFNTTHKAMLSHLHLMVSKGYLAVHPKYEKLITSLRTAYAKELDLDKEQTSYDDLLDGLRLALRPYNIE